jgi:undecaprenyl-diphosphatase
VDAPGLRQQLRDALPRLAVLAGIWAGLTGLLVAAGELIVHSAAITGFDHRVTRNIVSSRTPALNTAMRIVTWLGSWVALAVVAGLLVLLVVRKRLPVLAVIVAVLAWIGEAGGVRIAKEVVTRYRPPRAIWVVNAHGWSFPSGHTAAASLAFTVFALCVVAITPNRAVRLLTWLFAGLAIATVAFSRVELGVHWTTDVIAAFIFVACWLTAIVIVLGDRLREVTPSSRPIPLDSGAPPPAPPGAGGQARTPAQPPPGQSQPPR